VFCIHEHHKLIKYISVLCLPVIVNSNKFLEQASYILEQIVQPTYVRTRANSWCTANGTVAVCCDFWCSRTETAELSVTQRAKLHSGHLVLKLY